jgi:hypothetical protein
MSSSSNNSYLSKSLFMTQNIVLAGIGWAVLALLYFLLFSAKIPDANGVDSRAEWYVIGTNIFEALAYLGAGILCLRNWRSPQIVSSRNVWLAIAIGINLLVPWYRHDFSCSFQTNQFRKMAMANCLGHWHVW